MTAKRRTLVRALIALFTVACSAMVNAGDNEWTKIGPDAGSFRDVVLTRDSSAWASSQGVIYRSEDDGATWSVVGIGPDFGWACHIAARDGDALYMVDCGDTMTILSSSGESRTVELPQSGVQGISISGDTVYLATQSYGVYKGTIDGTEWTHVNSGLPGSGGYNTSVSAITASPADANVAWASVFAGHTWYTHNGGMSWSQSAGLPLTSYKVAAHPTDSMTAFAATPSGIYKTTDGGINWTSSGSGFSGSAPDIAVASSDGSELFAVTHEGDVFRSSDGAASWTSANGDLDSQGLDVIATDPVSGVVIASGREGAFRTTNDGNAWSFIGGIQTVEVDDFVQGSADTNDMFIGSLKAGVYVSADGGKTWSLERSGLDCDDGNVGCFAESLALGELDDLVAVGGTTLSTWSDASHQWQGPVAGTETINITAVAINPMDSDNIVVSYYTPYVSGGVPRGVKTTTDGGASWTGASVFGSQTVRAIAFGSADIVYAGVQGGHVYKSTDRGLSWTRVLTGEGSGDVFDIAVSPLNPDVIYLPISNGMNQLLKSIDGGGTWEEKAASLDSNGLADIAINPLNDQELLLATNTAGVYRSVDGGERWQAMNEGVMRDVPGASVVAFDKADPARLLAAFSDLGLVEQRVVSDIAIGEPSELFGATGATAEVTFPIENRGSAVTGVELIIDFSDGLDVVSSDGSCTVRKQRATCTLAGLMEESFDFAFELMAEDAGSFTVSAELGSTQPDPDPANNSREWEYVVTSPSNGGGNGSGGSGGGGVLAWLLGLLLVLPAGRRRRA